jgi:alkanesulfonate monooxygenase
MYTKSIEKVGIYDAAGAILSGSPPLEEAYWFGEGVLPLLEGRGPWRHPAPGPAAEQVSAPFAPARAEPIAREKAAAP